MSYTKQNIKNYFSKEIYAKCVKLKKTAKFDAIYNVFGSNKLKQSLEDLKNDSNAGIEVVVKDRSKYFNVEFDVEKGQITEETLDFATCNCEYYMLGHGECEHIAYVMLEFYDRIEKLKKEEKTNQKSSQNACKMLDLYVKKQLDISNENIKLIPCIHNPRQSYPYISFTVGNNKMYVVKRIDRFISSVLHEEEVSYGKNLKFVHSISKFDENSKKLISIISNIYLNQSNRYYYNTNSFVDNGKCIFMDGNSFYLFFELFQNTKIKIDNWCHKEVLLLRENPNLELVFRKKGDGATISYKGNVDELIAYGTEDKLFIIKGDTFYECDQEYSQKIQPMLSYIANPLFIGKDDLATFGSVVLPAIKEFVTIDDKAKIEENYTPEDCTPCFYFDINTKDLVVASLKFQYRDIEISENPTAKELELIKQNVPKEEHAKNFLKQYFTLDKKTKKYQLNFDQDAFLTEEIEVFKNQGDVFLSNKFNSKFVSTAKKPVLGVSVTNDLLSLDIDTGEFPAEELELLYDSFLKKSKYHKLKDGRFLFLEGSGFEKIAEISHMLQLTEKDLKKSQIKLPAYRSLYLDSVLSDTSESISLKRNKEFRHMMKDFKSINDSDYTPSDLLQAELKPYQILGFQWLKTLESYGFGGILADEMGLGKTIQVITYLLSLEQKLPSLVVCPASLLFNWRDELNKFAPSLNVMLLIGSAKERKEQLASKEGKKADVWVTSYDLIKRDRELYEGKKFYACILDEAQHIKNQTTLVSKTVKDINSKQRFVLTGTPIENRLSELWNLFDFLMPGYLFTHNTFLNKLEKPIVNSDEEQARKQLSLLVQPFIMRRLKKDVLKELPNKMEYVRKINLSEEERKIYIGANQKILGEVSNQTSSIQILAMLTHLRQLCCDPNLCFENYEGESSKLQACLELCQTMVDNGHKILLFSQFTSMLDIIRENLNQLDISNLTIEGSTSKQNRAKYVKEFQTGNTDVFLISLKAGGTGLNLTKADVVIHYDPWWNQAAQNQATDRAHRIGQEEHVQVYKLIAEGTIEEKILKLQEKKANLMESIFQETGDTKLSKDDILELLEL